MKDAGHLIRVVLVFAVGVILFMTARALLVPRSFGQYGHYRADSLNDIAAKPIAFAGHDACLDCHQEIQDLKKTGKHVGVACEACHGPLAAHVADCTKVVPKRHSLHWRCCCSWRLCQTRGASRKGAEAARAVQMAV